MIGRMTHSALLLFYAGERFDHAGRRFDEILAWDRRRLEMVHDYIQWMFPLPEASRFNPDAPLLSSTDIAAFHSTPHLQGRALAALDVMLEFYGLIRAAGAIKRGPAFNKSHHWLTPLNHNHLRFTRILLFLRHIGLEAVASQLLTTLQDIASHEGREAISERTLSFWADALKSSGYLGGENK